MIPPLPTADASFIRPDYAGGGLLNLMSTLASACGAPTPYPLLDARYGLEPAALRAQQRIVFVVVDGLGDDLLDPALTPTLCRHRVGRLSSVFPSTTASSVTTLLTALAPAQHGLTGWHMWFEEIATILAALPLVPRGPYGPEWNSRLLPPRLFSHRALSARIDRAHLTLSPQHIVHSPFNEFHSEGSSRFAYRHAAEFFPRLAACLGQSRAESGTQPLFAHAYLPDLDELLHVVGPGHDSVQNLLAWIDWGFSVFLQLAGEAGTTVILTADHGFLRAPDEHRIELDQHPKLAAMLARPLCGESRVAFAYVRPERRRDFEAYIARHLDHAISLHRSEDFIREGWFGPVDPPHAPHPRLLTRAGDYVLLMRNDWTIKDWIDGERRYRLRGVHAGASRAEMTVPLIVART